MSRADQARIKPKVLRQKKPEQDALLRIRNFNEVSYGLDRELAIIEASRCLDCKKPACVAGCPVEVDIPGFVRLIKDGEFVEAARLIKQKNALPAVCGRVCPQDDQCEKFCTPGQEGGTGRHRQPGALRGRLRTRDGRGVDPSQGTVDRQADRRGRQRPGRPHDGRRHGRQGSLGDHLRVAAQGRRRACLRHPGVPSAEGHRGGGDRLPAPAGGQDRAQLHRRPAVHDRRALRVRLRRGLRGYRGRTARSS